MVSNNGVGVLKPSRSEDLSDVSTEELLKHAQQAAAFLAASTPVRPLKPGRSEDFGEVVSEVPLDVCKRELDRFYELQADGEVLQMEGGTVNDDSYVETHYYEDLNSVDKLVHHRTGTGFISMEEGEVPFKLASEVETVIHPSYRSNPATNEWEPSPNVILQTDPKVHRSDP